MSLSEFSCSKDQAATRGSIHELQWWAWPISREVSCAARTQNYSGLVDYKTHLLSEPHKQWLLNGGINSLSHRRNCLDLGLNIKVGFPPEAALRSAGARESRNGCYGKSAGKGFQGANF
jgi:hypothetical protein